jgi:hypothetical protein
VVRSAMHNHTYISSIEQQQRVSSPQLGILHEYPNIATQILTQ